VAEHPKDGGLVAVLPGTDRAAKAILLLAHLDVVEARREDWSRDPFTLIEEGGYFYGRGTFDDKSMAAVWVDTLIRLRKQGYRPTRSIKMALTCGEEAGSAFEGAEYLVKHERTLIDAAFALNEIRVRRAGCAGTARGHGNRGGRENRPGLSPGSAEPGRPQFPPRQGQCHLSSGGGADAPRRL
jgi:acetylornithine deacetylase/succinyl-diaminopimelate desuccinylase-like protein